jgi:hypothetical protein
LQDASFTFLASSIICGAEKVFAKKLGFLPDKVELTNDSFFVKIIRDSMEE